MGGLVAAHAVSGAWLVRAGEASAWSAWLGERTVRARIRVGGRYGPLVDAEPWRLLTSPALHVDAVHLGVNGLALGVVGRWLEPVVGASRLVGLAVVGGVLGGVASHAVGVPYSDGASGALSAWLGAAAVWGRRADHRKRLGADIWRGPLAMVAAINVGVAMAVPGLDAAAHLVGTAVGSGWALVDRGARPVRWPWAVGALWALGAAAGWLGWLDGVGLR